MTVIWIRLSAFRPTSFGGPLERYYLVAGQNDPLCIDIPKGTYVPTFYKQGDIESDRSAQGNEAVESSSRNKLPE
jgi:hypothetical protein